MDLFLHTQGSSGDTHNALVVLALTIGFRYWLHASGITRATTLKGVSFRVVPRCPAWQGMLPCPVLSAHTHEER
ncbi:hypothetical protein ACFTWS_33470 [Streptomyces sp. NPDC057027]|uniref:hypothetical protein n=1 Tax=Streptomyces sp. NPDC057027 TaxID=3346004 RepID=UPI003642452D